MRTKYTINELLFKAYLICVVLGCILRNMFGEWKPIYDTYFLFEFFKCYSFCVDI